MEKEPKRKYKLRYWIIGIIPQVILVPVLTYICLKFIWGVLGALLLGIGFGLFIIEGNQI